MNGLLVNYTWGTKSPDQICGPLQGDAGEFKPHAFAFPYTRHVFWVSQRCAKLMDYGKEEARNRCRSRDLEAKGQYVNN